MMTYLKNKGVDGLMVRLHKLGEDSRCNEAYIDYMKKESFSSVQVTKPLISFVCPSYEPKAKYIEALLESMMDQTYANWELCVADGGSSPKAVAILRRKLGQDPRVKFTALDKNRGIALNTQAAVELSAGEYIGFIDHDDMLAPQAVNEIVTAINKTPDADFIYTDEDKFDDSGERFDPHFKPDWSEDTLKSYNYITHLMVIKRTLFERCGGMRTGFDGSQDHDLALRATKLANKIVHIPKVLYHWRAHMGSVALNGESKPFAMEAGKRAVQESVGECGFVEDGLFPNSYRVRYNIRGKQTTSIIIPNRNSFAMLKRLLTSIEEMSTDASHELIIVENGSDEPDIFKYYEALQRANAARIIHYAADEFNYSYANNLGAMKSKGDYLLFLNNDMEILSADWIESMQEFAQRQNTGAVGAKLIYPDGHVQHAGVVVGMNGWADHVCGGMREYWANYYSNYLVNVIRNVSAVTGACMMIQKSKFMDAGGFDDTFKLCGSDVELCLRLLDKGYVNVYTPYARLMHYESVTRRAMPVPQEDYARSYDAYRAMLMYGDPYYSLNFDYASRIPSAARTVLTPIMLNPIWQKAGRVL